MATEQISRINPIKSVSLYFAITLGISFFATWGPLALFKIPTISFVDNTKGPTWAIALFMFNGFVPSLTAIFLTWVLEGKDALKGLLKRVVQVKIGWRWYLAAVGLVVIGSAGQISMIYLLGYSFDFSLFLVQLPSFIPLILIGPLSEELGWRGYAQTRLQTRLDPLLSGGIVGVFWALWHLPLFFTVGASQYELHIPFLGFFCGITANSLLFAWLHVHTKGSIWTAVFYHWIYTFAAQVIATGVTRSPLYNGLEYSPYILLAIIVAVVWSLERKNSPRSFTDMVWKIE